jgi:hypothetical protein
MSSSEESEPSVIGGLVGGATAGVLATSALATAGLLAAPVLAPVVIGLAVAAGLARGEKNPGGNTFPGISAAGEILKWFNS